MTTASQPGQLTREKRDELIVGLHRAGLPFRQLGEIFDLSKSQIHRIYREATGEQLRLDAERHRRAMYADLVMLIDAYRPWVHSDEIPPDKDHAMVFLRAQKALAELLGLNEPRHISVSPNVTVDNPEAEAFTLQLAAYLRHSRSIGSDDHHPPPSKSILDARSRELAASESANGSHPGSRGHESSWAKVAANPDTSEG